MIDTFTTYKEWFENHYGRPFNVTREEWDDWCSASTVHVRQSDIDFDHVKEREGDAQ